MTGQLGAHEQVKGGHRASDQLLESTYEASTPLVLVPGSSQDVGAKLHLQLDLSIFDIFSGMAKSREHSNTGPRRKF